MTKEEKKAAKELAAKVKVDAKAKASKEKLAAETKAQVKEEAEIKAKARAEAEQEVKADEARKAQELQEQEEQANQELQEQAQILGVSASKVSVAGSRVKDKGVEAKKHHKIAMKRLDNRIKKKKAEAKLDVKAKRKRLLEARLNTPGTRITAEQRRQYAAELHAIKTGVWFAPTRDAEGKLRCWKVPRKMTAYDRFMATSNCGGDA